jgi:hypothetical protein
LSCKKKQFEDDQINFVTQVFTLALTAYVSLRNTVNQTPPATTKQQPAQSTPADPNQQKPQYEPNPKHGPEKKGNVSAAPKDGQTALDNSVQVKDTSPRRVGVDPANNQIVVLDQTTAANESGSATFHGHVRAWNELTPEMQNALKNANLTDARGNIVVGK